MVGGVSSWVFDNEFKNKLNSILTEYDKKKIEINKKYREA